MAAFKSLAHEFRADGVRFVLLADDAPGPVLDSTLNAVAWRTSVDYIGVAEGNLARRFDQSALVSRDYPYRVEFVLPSFLLVDGEGNIVRRAFGPAADVLRPALDSLVRGEARTPAAT